MKKRNVLLILTFALLGAFGCSAWVEGPEAEAAWYGPDSPIEVSVFYDALAPYGEWLHVEPWGWVWTPWDVEPGWRPYTDGHWAWTPLGWTWVSDWAWGWAPFHYGRWTYDPFHGWIWIPDTVWAPAWVAWRSGHGWIGWAPLPPGARWRIGIGLDLGGVDLNVGIVQHGWSFIGERDFLRPHVRRHLEALPRNPYFLRETEDRTRYEERDRRVAVRGIGREEIERSAGPVRQQRIEDLDRPPRNVPAPRPVAKPSPSQPGPGTAGRTLPPREATAPPKPPPTVDHETPQRRATREQRELQTWEQAQRQRLDQEQRQEREKPPPGETAADRDHRQQEERRALQREVDRERQLVDNRRERRIQEKDQAQKEQPKDKPKDKPPAPQRKPGKPPHPRMTQ